VDDSFFSSVEEGVLLSDGGWLYPIVRGVPVLLPYTTPIHQRFAHEHAATLPGLGTYRFPTKPAPPGEEAVFRSFSQEWRDYEYDGVLWDVSYDDNRRRLRAEVGLSEDQWAGRTWIEIGCGIGMTTAQAHQLSAADAVGVDLSVAVYKAAQHFRTNPFLHYVQASAFAPPFAPASFDIVYSRGVLHHTYSTKKAFLSVARLARRGGSIYVWVYGPGSLVASPLRVVAYAAELALRPLLSRASPTLATVALTPIAFSYLTLNALRRRTNPEVQPYTFERALHAARDRFTPRYAHRQGAEAVLQWFREAGCGDLEVVSWKDIPRADQEDYRRNTGVRGIRSSH
jgi:SAM-dependent methyltransferase